MKHASKLADASGDAAAAKTLADLAAKLTDEYNAAFYHKESSSYDTGTQTALALALALGAAPDAKATQKVLLDKLDAKGTHFDTGIIGLSQLFPVLGAAGAHDTALAVLAQTDYPSLGFEFANELEKTTSNLWELPDAPAEGTGMNSRNHHMYSSYSAYLVQSVAGVRSPRRPKARHLPACKRSPRRPCSVRCARAPAATATSTSSCAPRARVRCMVRRPRSSFPRVR